MLLEVVDRLCEVTVTLLDIIDQQAIAIEQSKIDIAVKKEFEELRENAKAECVEVIEKYKGK